METPSLQLAATIIDLLIDAKLVVPGDRTKLIGRFADGDMKPEDWHLVIERGISSVESK